MGVRITLWTAAVALVSTFAVTAVADEPSDASAQCPTAPSASAGAQGPRSERG